MELRQIRCFVAVAEELHFGRAARRLSISQPPLSRTIQQLESELGAKLLERTRRRVEPTPAGVAFLSRCRQILTQVEGSAREAREVAQGRIGTLSVSFVGSAMYSILPRVLRAMRTRFPGVGIELHEMATDAQVAALLDRRTQVAFVRPGIVHPQLRSVVLLREPLLLALPAGHPLAERKVVPLESLSEDPFILFPRQTRGSLGNRVLDLCAESGFAPRVVQEALEMQTALGLVAGGLGVAMVPGGVRRLSWPGIVLRPMPRPVPDIELALACRTDEPSPIVPRFLELARSAVRARK